MGRSDRMKPVVKVAEQRERAAARDFGECQQRLAEAEARLEELQGYRHEYGQRFQQSGGDGLSARRLHEYRTFLHRLNEAIAQQQALVGQLRQDCTAGHAQWLETRRRSQVLDKVVDRYRAQERREEDRREQQDSDERALTRRRTPRDE
ncbi:MAG TPA: flagellar export protein FliJ [Gammaproteobacteria bacterium]|nr:flagellar export protein FliJ [Gammaproteobacteria bacterium]